MNMKSCIRKLYAVILSCMIFCSTLQMPVFAAESYGSKDSTNFVFDNTPKPFSMSGNGTNLVIKNAPLLKKYKKICVKFLDGFGNTIEKYYATCDGSNSTSISLSKLKNGKFYLELYVQNSSSGYIEVIKDQLFPIVIKSKKAYFPVPVFFDQNQEIMELQNGYDMSDQVLSSFLKNSSNVQCTDPKIVSLSKEITESCTDDYSKMLAIHDWVCSNIIYHELTEDEIWSNSDFLSASAVLTNKKAVDIGFVNLTTALLRASGIPTKIVAGYSGNAFEKNARTDYLNALMTKYSSSQKSALSAGTNAWNMAYSYSQKRWITLDTYMDAMNGIYKDEKAHPIRHLYFDSTPYTLALDHKVDETTGDNQYQGSSFGKDYMSCEVGDVYTIPACFTIVGADKENMTYASTDNKIATIDYPRITGISPGTAKITVTTTSPKAMRVIYLAYIKPAKATIDCYLDGAYSNVGHEQFLVNEGSMLSAPPNPTRKGYTFTGWYTRSVGPQKIEFPIKVTSRMAIYAQWKKNS